MVTTCHASEHAMLAIWYIDARSFPASCYNPACNQGHTTKGTRTPCDDAEGTGWSAPPIELRRSCKGGFVGQV
eukprot:5158271-Pyramimonas_sp.AAC.1